MADQGIFAEQIAVAECGQCLGFALMQA